MQFQKAGGIAAVATALAAHLSSPIVQEYACGILCSISAALYSLTDTDVILPRLVATLSTHAHHPNIVSVACEAVYQLTLAPLHRQQAGVPGIMTELLKAAHSHVARPEVVRPACNTVWVWSIGSAVRRCQLVENGALSLCFQALCVHTCTPVVLEKVCGALVALTEDQQIALACVALEQGRALQELVSVVARFTNIPSLQTLAATAMFNIVRTPGAIKSLDACGSSARLVQETTQCLALSLTHDRLNLAGILTDTLIFLCSLPSLMDRFAALDGCGILVSALRYVVVVRYRSLSFEYRFVWLLSRFFVH